MSFSDKTEVRFPKRSNILKLQLQPKIHWSFCSKSVIRLEPYHLSGGAVFILVVEVTQSVVRLDQASQSAVQSQVRNIICGEHQQVVGFFSPAYFILSVVKKKHTLHMLESVILTLLFTFY